MRASFTRLRFYRACLPVAVGALITLYLFGALPLSLYAFVGMIMLVGIVKKNAIMMIDSALHKQRGEEKANATDAIYEAALVRFRAHHDDHHGRIDGHVAGGDRVGRGSEARQPPRSGRGWWTAPVTAGDALPSHR